MENILIVEDKIYLIDFLDSFCNSWFFDIAKVLQDLECKWSYRHLKSDNNRDIRLLIAKNSLINEIAKLPDATDLINSIYSVLLLNLLRIYPYTKDKETMDFLNNNVEKVLLILKGVL